MTHFFIITARDRQGQYKIGYHTGSKAKLRDRYQTYLSGVDIRLFTRCNGKRVKTKVRGHLNLINISFVKNMKHNDSDWVAIDETELIGIANSIIREDGNNSDDSDEEVGDINDINNSSDVKQNVSDSSDVKQNVSDQISDDENGLDLKHINSSNINDNLDDDSESGADDSTIDLTSGDIDVYDNSFSDVKVKVEDNDSKLNNFNQSDNPFYNSSDIIDFKTSRKPKRKLGIIDDISSFWDTFITTDPDAVVRSKELYSLYLESMGFTNSNQLTFSKFSRLVLSRVEVTTTQIGGKHHYAGIKINLGFGNKSRR